MEPTTLYIPYKLVFSYVVVFGVGLNCYKSKLVREPNSGSCLDLIFAAPPCEKVIIVPDTNYITSAIRKFLLDMPSPDKLQNIGLLI